jgi:hypothetical protein
MIMSYIIGYVCRYRHRSSRDEPLSRARATTQKHLLRTRVSTSYKQFGQQWMGNGTDVDGQHRIRASSIEAGGTVKDPGTHRCAEGPRLEMDRRAERGRFKSSDTTDAVDDQLALDLELSSYAHVLPLACPASAINFGARRLDAKW